MKYKVKAGENFEVEQTVVVHVHVHTNSQSSEESFSWKKAVTIFVVTAVFGTIIAAVAHGLLTGDFSLLKAIAENGQRAIAMGIEHAQATAKK